MNTQKLMSADKIAQQLQEQRNGSGAKRKIYKAESNELRQAQLSEHIGRDIAGLARTIHRERVDLKDMEAIQRRVMEYLEACKIAGTVPTVGGMAVFGFGLSRRRLNKFMADHPEGEATHFLEMAKDVIEDVVEVGGLTRDLDPAMVIFTLKNDHNRADRVQLEPVPPTHPLGEEMSRDEFMAKVADVVVEVDDDG